MASPRNPSRSSDGGTGRFRLELVGLTTGADRPDITIQALDANGEVLSAQKVEQDGGFTLSHDILGRAATVVVGASDDKEGVRSEGELRLSAEDFRAQAANGVLALAEPVWSRLRFYWTCVSGHVRVCRRRRWWYDDLIQASTMVSIGSSSRAGLASRSIGRETSIAAALTPSLGELLAWPVRCHPVCRGTVTVYRRTCCCYPIVIDDWRISDLIRDLERVVSQLPTPNPKFKIPPPPPPPIGDPLRTPYFKGGALNELALNAVHDLEQMRSLPLPQAAQYVEARPYLYHRLCSCGRPVRVGAGSLQHDGGFNICWLESIRLFRPNCFDQYAYVVKQTIGGTTTTIYDGLAAGAWFAAGENPVLTTYNPQAFSCDQTGDGDGDAFVFLDLIGDTESHELTTPTSTGWDRVAAPSSTSGLLFPNPGVQGHLRNLGGGVELTFIFSLGMRDPAIGAHYYRVSVSEADANGNPTGSRYYYGDGLAWEKVVGADIVPESLGPVAVGGENNLYRIPYSDEAWVGSVRYHALINTLAANLNTPPAADLASPATNRLVTLEVFNAAGQRLRPLGAPASGQPGAEAAKAFKFRRWFQPGGSIGDDTVEVPFAALTHLFCWDNRPPVADITRLVMNGAASDEECQFLEGPATSQFAVEYRAYVADQRFQEGHSIGWLRGLNASAANGGVGSLPTPLSPDNVGKPPALPATSGSNTFELMLTRLDAPNPPVVLPRCSFAVTLTTYAKTTNGENFSYPFGQETAAFALAID
ncbi:MAG TPA: hypothetical protein VLI91_05955 [Roseiarcus sp.]|nr:hypothetical protein [Roseiarcus sp.]